jgi:hypothetical protein
MMPIDDGKVPYHADARGLREIGETRVFWNLCMRIARLPLQSNAIELIKYCECVCYIIEGLITYKITIESIVVHSFIAKHRSEISKKATDVAHAIYIGLKK